MNKSKRIEKLEQLTLNALYALQLGKEIKTSVFGAVDVPLFGVRFRFIEPNTLEDTNFSVSIIAKEEEFDSDQIFLILAEKGYVHWLRHKVSQQNFLVFWEMKERWQRFLSHAIVHSEKVLLSPYKVALCKQLQRTPLVRILSDNPATFDWLLAP